MTKTETPQATADRLLKEFFEFSMPRIGGGQFDYSTGVQELARQADHSDKINDILAEHPEVQLTEDPTHEKREDKLREMYVVARQFQHACRPEHGSQLHDIFITSNVRVEMARENVWELMRN